MQICIPPPIEREGPKRQSVFDTKRRIRADHEDNCNCCCCTSERTCCKYVQPEVPKSFAPLTYYWKSDVPMEKNTTYNLSYWECPTAGVDRILPQDSLVTGDGEISDQTTYKCSYFEHCGKPEAPIIPCQKQWLGRGPMQDVTTQKHDFTWKNIEPLKPYKAINNLYCHPVRLDDDTTYKLSYFPYDCTMPCLNYAPKSEYLKSDIPMEKHTTYNLSYWPNCSTKEEDFSQKVQYTPPTEPMDGCTTYKLSFWPYCAEKRSPIKNQENDNVLNAGCCNETNTTYNLSYFGCGGDTRTPIRQKNNIEFSTCPFAYDTIHKMSFLGNWCAKPEKPIVACAKQFLGKGPMQDVTTQKHDYTWKNMPVEQGSRAEDNFTFSDQPVERCTTYKLSYFENDSKSLIPTMNYAPLNTYCPPDVPTENETTMRLSYQPVEGSPVEKPWSEKPCYQYPVHRMEGDTIYSTSFIPPGTMVQ